MAARVFSVAEANELRTLLKEVPDSPAFKSWPMGDRYEVYPTKGDFLATVQHWLTAHGFQRQVDRNIGTFYVR